MTKQVECRCGKALNFEPGGLPSKRCACDRVVSPINAGEPVFIVFDGPPSAQSGRFIEVENTHGASVQAGGWKERADGLWQLGPFVVLDGACITGEVRRESAESCLEAEPGYPPGLELSIESAASEPKAPVRLVLGATDGFVEIMDVEVTSHGNGFQILAADRHHHRVGLTLSEAQWMLARLPEIIARAARQRQFGENCE